MISTIISFVAGLGLAALTFWVAGGGVIGLVGAVIVAAGGYIGVSYLTQPERKLGKVLASAVPNGQKAIEAIDMANARMNAIKGLMSQVRDPAVRKEVNDIVVATKALTSFVEDNPRAYETLRHFINVYGDQTQNLLQGYVEVERSGARDQLAKARIDTINAMQVLEQTAAGELSHAVEAKTLALSADSEAIARLASMDGYSVETTHDTLPSADGTTRPGGDKRQRSAYVSPIPYETPANFPQTSPTPQTSQASPMPPKQTIQAGYAAPTSAAPAGPASPAHVPPYDATAQKGVKS
ncbi:5-bromo-4-chloroindolyl phosphate hydrolysis family protein [Bifidobacterium sp. 82T24]|uniref:5-bromo-4-chloroindolyl phosphate hydrolysis family protein n=1 Tax=Bifidobacterium pluvialisilvae TaxID=2834436 RepID=UPI001C58B30E|nr:5-bromo-4-chloroindolyl phosphate hydrolysis family protein [Bifidobacterium pluvialisilvae]MBW3089059.1 5-bromo-4-chloroindolyl phosphate hydrolysis family protein [Bifidobacterium pluvialisilvae]